MSFFVTGANGFIGGSIAARLAKQGKQVRGLVRTEEIGSQLAKLGVTPVVGSLDDSELLIREARQSDGVINAADSDHRLALEALIEGLAGSNKRLLHTSGSSIVADNAQGQYASTKIFDDNTPVVPESDKAARVAIDRLAQDASKRGILSSVLCNTNIYGNGLGLRRDSFQVPKLIAQARKSGTVRYVGTGLNIWSNTHIEDVVDLYLIAMEKAAPGGFYFVENGEASFIDIGVAIADRLGLGAPKSWSIEEATEEWGHMHAAYTFGCNSRVRAKRARAELGWRPKHNSLLEWIRTEA